MAVHEHLIPDDGAPHAPTGECGCGPTAQVDGNLVRYEHRQVASAAQQERGQPSDHERARRTGQLV